ncbi:Tex-like N-terminal domain-containing protein [Blastopirellula marina]|uniref:Ribosomal protein S1-like RNA-binding domain protein n=1 Tax=Blastopirellula marina DSM 3645 TaxID=314230 RepID=A3ZZ79_9BACT|nr:Tex family protein [Blastopirellula marina]EAQ78192.1 ribosomal protein S1-like RNA-binding domain protein [Blastopirellula marina DSM 3645]
MEITVSSDLSIVARELGLPVDQVQRTVELLDDGNTVPFITRYRKDETGGLDEEQIRKIQARSAALRQLEERKQTILKSIESQGKLTEKLADKIQKAPTTKLLEDLYLPFKPKKQSLATQARQRGLEPLADEVMAGNEAAADLPARAAAFVSAENDLPDVAAVLQGVRHILAEEFAENAILRGRLRKLMWKTGTLVTLRIEQAADASDEKDHHDDEAADNESETPAAETAAAETVASAESQTPDADQSSSTAEPSAAESNAPEPNAAESSETASEAEATPAPAPPAPAAPAATIDPKRRALQEQRRDKRRKQKDRERSKKEKAFKDYYDYREPISKIPHHRVLAINRGDRTRFIRVKIECDWDRLFALAEETAIPADHSQTDFLKPCLRDGLQRLMLPSLEREIRRELTEHAEEHAVDVFACNLRKLLLQPPVSSRRVMAIDPGFRSGCKLVALDQFGSILEQGVIHLIGPEDRVARGRQRLIEMIRQHAVDIVAIGNGTACRETENLVASIISKDITDREVVYVIVNEAGASVYSTSELGREEFPDFDATVRGTISIGRRLLDPLSELVKINPSNIGVGLYQHDVKSKHLKETLDNVVESCVNYVGVDVNQASPALLSYVSGLNQLTARRLYEYRRQNGPFTSREEFKKVAGFGESAFVQAAGFLKIRDGENPLDATWIHPESYEVAEKVLAKLDATIDQVRTVKPVEAATPAPAPVAEPAAEAPVVEEPTTESPVVAETPATETVEAETPSTAAAEPAVTEDVAAAEDAATTEEATAEEAVTEEAVAETSAEAPVETPPTPVKSEVPSAAHAELVKKIAGVSAPEFAAELEVGEHLTRDILNSLSRPGRDPRADFPPPLFRRGIMKLEDLRPGMELSGTVLNVVDFGAFVDIGLHDSGMVHISRLANRYVSDPHEVVSVGDVITVWVVEIDKDRRRVSLTAIEPGTEKAIPAADEKQRVDRPERAKRPPRGKNRPGGNKPQHAGHGKPKAKTFVAKSKPTPKKPISEAMKEGKEPLRSFGDLAQFLNQSQKEEKEKKKPKGK